MADNVSGQTGIWWKEGLPGITRVRADRVEGSQAAAYRAASHDVAIMGSRVSEDVFHRREERMIVRGCRVCSSYRLERFDTYEFVFLRFKGIHYPYVAIYGWIDEQWLTSYVDPRDG